MSKISDARTNYTPRTATVTVCLDAGVSDERDALMRALAETQNGSRNERLTRKSDAEKIKADIVALEEREREHLHTLRFTKLQGLAWADLTALYPARNNSAFDQDLGYNHHAAAIHAAKVNGVELVDGQDEAVALDDDDWKTILEVGTGWDVENIVTTVLELNVLRASRDLARLKKD